MHVLLTKVLFYLGEVFSRQCVRNAILNLENFLCNKNLLYN